MRGRVVFDRSCDFLLLRLSSSRACAGLGVKILRRSAFQSDGIPQPLSSLYQTERCLERAEELIIPANENLSALLPICANALVPFAELTGFARGRTLFLITSIPRGL